VRTQTAVWALIGSLLVASHPSHCSAPRTDSGAPALVWLAVTGTDLASSPKRLNAATTQPDGVTLGAIIVLLVAHVLLGVGAAMNRNVATVHAVLTTVVALGVMIGSSRPERIVAVAAYGGVCDVFWRMSHSKAPWELSKYLLALGALTLLIRFVKKRPRAILPVLLLLALVPGMLMAFGADSFAGARETISSTEMGVVAFGLAAIAFRHLVAGRKDAWNLSWLLLGPLVATLTIVTHSVVTNPNIDFSANSNFETTAGYGPNQVSSLIGLIVVICLLIAFLPASRRLWPVLTFLGIWSMVGTFLTFSRGGIYSAVLAGCAMLLVGIGSRGARARSIILVGVSVVAVIIIFNSVNDFSGNWLEARYEKAGSTGRDTIAQDDLKQFGSHPLLGAGSGGSYMFRGSADLAGEASHTEYTRLLADHGLLGLAVLALMAVMLVQAYRAGPTRWNRLMVVALGVWSATVMMHAATRIGAVSVMLALTQVRLDDPTLDSTGAQR